ncbi:MAG: insulinase family protein [Blastochloris sp.]|nr:insulinase family protein [Blastochloris sp.]
MAFEVGGWGDGEGAGVILEEIRMYEDQPSSLVMDRLNEKLWPGSSLGLPITGSEASVSGLKRGALLEFWRRHYHPGNLNVALAGSFDPVRAQGLIARRLRGKFPGAQPGRFMRVRRREGRQMGLLAIPRPVQQASVALGVRGYARRDPKRFAEKVLSVILGENMSSRLFQVLRERHGLAYSVQSSIQHFHDQGAFYLQMGVDVPKLGAALRLTGKELRRIQEKEPSPAELVRAKDFLIGQMKLGMESTSNRMMWLGESMIGFGRIQDLDEVKGAIASVTAEQVSAVARELFVPGRMVLACVGPEVGEVGLGKHAGGLMG